MRNTIMLAVLLYCFSESAIAKQPYSIYDDTSKTEHFSASGELVENPYDHERVIITIRKMTKEEARKGRMLHLNPIETEAYAPRENMKKGQSKDISSISKACFHNWYDHMKIGNLVAKMIIFWNTSRRSDSVLMGAMDTKCISLSPDRVITATNTGNYATDAITHANIDELVSDKYDTGFLNIT